MFQVFPSRCSESLDPQSLSTKRDRQENQGGKCAESYNSYIQYGIKGDLLYKIHILHILVVTFGFLLLLKTLKALKKTTRQFLAIS